MISVCKIRDSACRRIFLLLSQLVFLTSMSLPAWSAPVPVVVLQPAFGTVNDNFTLQVSVRSQQQGQLDQPEFDSSEDFEINFIGMSTRNENNNGVQNFEMSFSFRVSPRLDLPAGLYTLPRGVMHIEGNEVELNPTKLTIIKSNASVGVTRGPAPREQQAAGIDFTQVVDNYEPYVGEQLLYRAEVASSLGFAQANLSDMMLNGFWRESYGKNQEQIRNIGDTVVHSVLEGLFPSKPGDLEIPDRTLTAAVRVPRPYRQRPLDMFEDFFNDMDGLGVTQTVTKRFVASGLKLRVKELPPAPQPNLGYVPVGTIRVNTSLDQTTAKQGESVTLTIDIVGDANLKPYELPPPSAGDTKEFKIYVDKPQIEVTPTKSRILFRKTYKVSFVPQRGGIFALPQYKIATFDPKEKRYIVYDTGVRQLRVSADAQADQLVVRGQQPDTGQSSGNDKTDVTQLGEGLFPQRVGSETYRAPQRIDHRTMLLVMFGLPLSVMLAGAYSSRRRAVLSDPAHRLQAGAYRSAVDSLKELSGKAAGANIAEEALDVLRRYLGERFRLRGESLTSSDVKDVLSRKIKDERTVEEIEAVFKQLQRQVYGGAAAADSDAGKKILDETRKIIDSVEKHGKR